MAFNVQRALDDGYTQQQIDAYLASQNLESTEEVTEVVDTSPNKYQQWLDANPDKKGTEDYLIVEQTAKGITDGSSNPIEPTKKPNKYQQWLDANPDKKGTEDYLIVERSAKGITDGSGNLIESTKGPNKDPQSQIIPGEDFGRGAEQYYRQMGELFGFGRVLLGKALGNDDMIMAGFEQAKSAQANQAPYQKDTDSFNAAIDKGVGGFIDYVQYMAGQGVGMIAEAGLTAVIGAVAGSAFGPGGTGTGLIGGIVAKSLVKKGVKQQANLIYKQILKKEGKDAAELAAGQFITKQAVEELGSAQGKKEVLKAFGKDLTADQAVKKLGKESIEKAGGKVTEAAIRKETANILNKKIGSVVGIAGMSAKFGSGEVTGRAVDEALGAETDPAKQLKIIQSLSTSKLAALSAAHAIADYTVARIGLNALDDLQPAAQNMFLSIARSVGLAGLKEAPVEVIQTMIERYGAGLDLTSQEAITEYQDAAAGGFFMPSGPAAVGGVRGSYRIKNENIADPRTQEPLVKDDDGGGDINKLIAQGKKQKATNSAQADADESAANPVALTDTKLASFGINKNTKSYTALKNLDMTNPDNHVVFEQILEEHDARQVKNKTSKTLNEKELNNYRSVYGNQTAGASNAVPNVPPPAGAEGSAATDGSGAAGSQSNTGRPARRTKKQPAALDPKVEQAELDRLDAEVVAAQERKAERDNLDARKAELNKDDPKPLVEGQLPATPPRPGTSGERTVLEATDDFIKADKFVTNKNVDGATISQIASRLRGPKVKGRKRREVSIAAATRIFNELEDTGRYTVTTSSKGVKKLISKVAKAKPTRAEKLSALGNVTETEVIETETAEAEAAAAADANVDVDSEVIEADDYSNMSESDFAEGALDVDDNVDDFTTDEYKESRTGALDTSITQETTVSVIRELVSEFGDAVNKAIDMGKLVIVDNASELPSNISISNTANGAYDGNTGTAFIIANRVKKGESRRVLLHEIGEHHGLEGLLGKDYTRTLNRLKSLKNTDKVVANVWAQVTAQYKNLTVGDVPFNG